MTFLNRTEFSALRGIAIMGIMMHNFLHWLGPMVKENEYQFINRNVFRYTNILKELPDDTLLQLISFFGHYGVPVFLFISGYGLVLKYENQNTVPANNGSLIPGGTRDAWTFIRQHFMKLFPMMMLGFCTFAMVDWMTPGRHHWAWQDIMAQITMTINIFENPDRIIWPGPYWFFGLMMQLYIVYRLLLYRRHWAVTIAMIFVCWGIQTLCDPDGETLNRVRYNFIGGMLPFGMGILLGHMERVKPVCLNKAALGLIFIISLTAVLTLSLFFEGWLWVPAFVVTLHLALIKLLPAACLRPLNWIGALSSAIFVCHPITRKIFIPISHGGNVMDGLVIYIVSSLMLAMLFRIAVNKIKNN